MVSSFIKDNPSLVLPDPALYQIYSALLLPIRRTNMHRRLCLFPINPLKFGVSELSIPLLLKYSKKMSQKKLFSFNQGRNQDFAKGGGGLKMEIFSDVILMTYFR